VFAAEFRIGSVGDEAQKGPPLDAGGIDAVDCGDAPAGVPEQRLVGQAAGDGVVEQGERKHVALVDRRVG